MSLTTLALTGAIGMLMIAKLLILAFVVVVAAKSLVPKKVLARVNSTTPNMPTHKNKSIC